MVVVVVAGEHVLVTRFDRITAFFLQFLSFQNQLVVLVNLTQQIITTVIAIIATISIAITRAL